MKLRQLISSTLLAALATAALAACGAPKLDEKKPAESQPAAGAGAAAGGAGTIKLGLTISLSGGTADMGEAAKNGALLAIKEINARGGIKGKKLELIAYDDEVKPEKSLETVKRLIDQDKVVAILGPANTGSALAHVDFVQQAEVTELVTASAGTPVTQKHKDKEKHYIFRASMVDSAQAPTIIDFLVKHQKLSKIAILHDTTAYGVSGKNDLIKRLEKWGLKPVAVESFQLGDTDLTTQVKKAKEAGAEAIATYALAPELAQMMRALQKIDWKPVVAGSWTLSGEMFKKLAGDLVNNNVYTVMSVHPSISPKYAEFQQKFLAEYKVDGFPPVSAQTYDGVYMLAKAIEAVGEDSKKIRDYLEDGLKDFQGVTGIPADPFSKENHEAIGYKQMFMGKWVNGKLEPVPNSSAVEP